MTDQRPRRKRDSNSTISAHAGGTACRNGRRRPASTCSPQVSRQGRRLRHRVRRHHASRHAHGCADPRHREHADARPAIRSGASSAPASRCRSRRANGASSRRGSRERATPEDPQGRHRHDQHRQPPQARPTPTNTTPIRRASTKRPPSGSSRSGVKMVGVDVQALDHPLGTKLVDHGPGPSHPHLFEEYKARDRPRRDGGLPVLGAGAQDMMVKGGIPGIENIGGDLDTITGKRCTFMAFPWRWPEGEGCARARRRGGRPGPNLPHRDRPLRRTGRMIIRTRCAIRCRCSTSRTRSR